MVVGMNTHTSMKRIEFYTVICIQGCYDYGHYKSYIKLMVLAWFTKLKQVLTSYHITCSLSPFSSIHSPSSQWPGWLTMTTTEWRNTFYWTEQIFRSFFYCEILIILTRLTHIFFYQSWRKVRCLSHRLGWTSKNSNCKTITFVGH